MEWSVRRILLVEDEEVLRESYEMILSIEPYDLDVAVNGEEALKKCRQNTYDLILLDLMMPIVDGPTFLERYNEEFGPPNKVIILSNLSSSQELSRAMELGAQRSILKATLSPKQLIATVRYEVGAA
jgi:two-component system response regulator CpxR